MYKGDVLIVVEEVTHALEYSCNVFLGESGLACIVRFRTSLTDLERRQAAGPQEVRDVCKITVGEHESDTLDDEVYWFCYSVFVPVLNKLYLRRKSAKMKGELSSTSPVLAVSVPGVVPDTAIAKLREYGFTQKHED